MHPSGSNRSTPRHGTRHSAMGAHVPNRRSHAVLTSVVVVPFSTDGVDVVGQMDRSCNNRPRGGSSATNSPVVNGSQSLPTSRHNSVIHRPHVSADSPNGTNIMSPPFKGTSPPHLSTRTTGGIPADAAALVMMLSDEEMKMEAEGEWVEARETLTGRVMWYNTMTHRLIFDTPPDGVTQLPGSQYTLS